MPSHTASQRADVRQYLQALATTTSLKQAGLSFFRDALGYDTSREGDLDGSYEDFADTYQTKTDEKFSAEKALTNQWKEIHLLFQLTEEEMVKTIGLFDDREVDKIIMESYIFVAIDLLHETYNRGDLAAITRQVNALFRQPVLLLFRYGSPNKQLLTLAVIDRRLNKRDRGADDVLKKISFIKDIDAADPVRAHVDILTDLHRKHLTYRDQRGKERAPRNFVELHRAWRAVLSVSELNKRFYAELSDWFFWATGHDAGEHGKRAEVAFPAGKNMSNDERSRAVIRLITRVIFIWFLKEKGLVPDHLFDRAKLEKDVNFGADESAYYKVILQNLFFAILNTKVKNRDVIPEHTFQGKNEGHDNKSLLRYPELCTRGRAHLKELFGDIPFLNGGLFECLDRGKNYVDCFSSKAQNQPYVPNELFFREEAMDVDLQKVYGTKARRQVRGLFTILKSYKFTIDENTPVEEEVALDPELLGKVFENLLAAYNEETSDTARRQTGSFYTPREIVNYMVEEGLIAYLEDYILQRIKPKSTGPKFQPLQLNMFDLTPAVQTEFDFDSSHNDDAYRVSLRANLRKMVSFNQDGNPFAREDERRFIVTAIDEMRILDPAVGSGAYPMGVLQLLVHVLKKIDPDNRFWRALQEGKQARSRVQGEEGGAKYDPTAESDYNRKLYLIRNCIFGVDLQPIAIQICKLRFFVSLAINERKTEAGADNFGIKPLPNLETKFVAANSLVKLKGGQMTISSPEIDDLRLELKRLRAKSFNLKSRKAKLKNREADEAARKRIGELIKANDFKKPGDDESADQIAQWNPYDQSTSAGWFDPKWMFGFDSYSPFDLVIGNPPYRQIQKYDAATKAIWRGQGYSTYVATGDIYSLFYERGVQLLKPGGILSYITSNNWMRAKYGEATRKFFATQNPLVLVDFGMALVFESAAALVNILILQKAKNERITRMVRVKDNFDATVTELTQYVDEFSSIQNNLSANSWVAYTQEEYELKRRVEQQGVRLDNRDEKGKPLAEKVWDININRGILTGYNAAFIIDQAKRDKLVAADPKSAEIIRPILRGRDVRAWVADWAGLYLINTHNGVKTEGIPPIDVAKEYPAVYAWLESHQPKISKRYDQGDHWSNLRNLAYLNDFNRSKIIYPEITNSLPFTYDISGEYLTNNKCFIISGHHLAYLTAVFNSPLFRFFFKDNFPELLGNSYETRSVFFEQIPIKLPDPETEWIFERMSNYIIRAKKSGAHDVEGLFFQQMVNGLVYELYFEDSLHRVGIQIMNQLRSDKLLSLEAGDSGLEQLSEIYTRYHDKRHPIRIGLFKLDTVREVRVIEGKA